MTAEGGTATAIELTFDNREPLLLDVTLEKGESFVFDGGEVGRVYDASWHVLSEVAVDTARLTVAPGSHSVSLTAFFEGDENTSLRL